MCNCKLYVLKRKKDNKYLVGNDFSTNDISKADKFKTGPACAIKMNLDRDKVRLYRNRGLYFESDYKMEEVN